MIMGRTRNGEPWDVSVSGISQHSPISQIKLGGGVLLSILLKKSDTAPCKALVFSVSNGCPKVCVMNFQSFSGNGIFVVLDKSKKP